MTKKALRPGKILGEIKRIQGDMCVYIHGYRYRYTPMYVTITKISVKISKSSKYIQYFPPTCAFDIYTLH